MKSLHKTTAVIKFVYPWYHVPPFSDLVSDTVIECKHSGKRLLPSEVFDLEVSSIESKVNGALTMRHPMWDDGSCPMVYGKSVVVLVFDSPYPNMRFALNCTPIMRPDLKVPEPWSSNMESRLTSKFRLLGSTTLGFIAMG